MRDAPEPDKVGGLTVQQIEAEEGRRSGSAASKRPQMISDTEFVSTLNLPTPDALSYVTRFGLPPAADVTNNTGTLPLTLNLNDFLSRTSSKPHAQATLGPNGYLCVLIALFNRVTQFRQESGSGRPEDVSSALYWSEGSARETYEWGMDVVIVHATAATLHGPEYNMMTIGNQIAGTLCSFGGGGQEAAWVMTEVAGGEVTMALLSGMKRQGRGVGKESEGVAEELVRKSMGKGVEEVLEEPGKCAGTMVMGQGK
ncbi:hypothetical protein HK104_001636 [Borealophlyctis nickersoniae]|nr:hypothetical protein HK104_001636 [Borealophlyctis nickersoniae]